MKEKLFNWDIFLVHDQDTQYEDINLKKNYVKILWKPNKISPSNFVDINKLILNLE